MTITFGVGDKTDEQYAVVGAIGRIFVKFVSPETKRPPRAQLVRYEADDIRALPWQCNKFEVVQPDFFEGELTWGHVPPTS